MSSKPPSDRGAPQGRRTEERSVNRMAHATHPRRGICLVLAAAPGGGKTSVSRALLETEPELSLSVSATTRSATFWSSMACTPVRNTAVTPSINVR